MTDLAGWERQIAELDRRLSPIANRPVAIADLIWMALRKRSPHPLDAAGVRSEAEGLLETLLDAYRNGEDDSRPAVRGLFARYPSFAWAATLPYPPTTDENFRRHLLLFSMQDQGRDTRDAILLLEELCKAAGEAGVGTAPILLEIAAISSDENKYGMGSTRALLLRAI